ncbi:UDP-2,3-diacylglucosamine diphosphatase [Chitinolyticbacter meiyuanensis]|uniref:UDP-2,3-diacylglucosamine diphosphatase n=1 Tax=Chitinolyticbacter meiyuanensis TaxID=682798 RepID=UPI0011E5E266|nr:UDP-2,3-diacylglucosamine diphosphatase [Chitinolyticbacter meiyuanensis]
MPRRTLFISDLHLSPADPATAQAFARFLADTAREADALYILGDLFEVWVGDDQLDEPFYANVARQLKALADHGVAVYFMAGNRDFLCGDRFAREAGLTVLADPSVVTTAGQRLLLAHGDALCTDDAGYQRFRRIVRHPLTQWLWLRLPYRWRNRKAAQIRDQSSSMNRSKAAYIMDVNPDAVVQLMRDNQCDTLIHGHTHRPTKHTVASGTRWVLPDWHAGVGGYLRVNERELTLLKLDGQRWPISTAAKEFTAG